jgi:hypothetical protein
MRTLSFIFMLSVFASASSSAHDSALVLLTASVFGILCEVTRI